MKIRSINKFDMDQVVDMLKEFQREGPANLVEFTGECDITDVSKIAFTEILHGRGILLVAEHDSKIVGLIMGIIDGLMWDRKTLILREMAYYVDVEYRSTTVGYRLLKEYLNKAKKLVHDGRIKAYTMCRLSTSNIKYEKFGMKKVEEVFVGA